MKYKVAELEGALLAAAVAKAERLEVVSMHAEQNPEYAYCMVRCGHDEAPEKYGPQRHAAQGLAIIERERINVGFDDQGGTDRGMWCAYLYDGDGSMWFADTFLIAAMRAYVASKFGEEVELP